MFVMEADGRLVSKKLFAPCLGLSPQQLLHLYAMLISEAIERLKTCIHNHPYGLTLYPGASDELIAGCERAYGITFPEDFKIFYRFTDGLETHQFIFRLIPLQEMIDNRIVEKYKELDIAEYLIYSDMWELEINPDDCNDYKISIWSDGNQLVLTNSLAEFVDRLLTGDLSDEDGLFQWQQEVESQSIYTTKLKTTESLLTLFYDGLKYGIISRKEVIDWADHLVMHEDHPELFFMELSLQRDDKDLISMLHTIHLPKDIVAARALLGLLYHQLSAGTINADQAITIMDNHHFPAMLTEFEMDQIYSLTDGDWLDYPLVDEHQLMQHTLGVLASYKNFEISNYKTWGGRSSQMGFRIELAREKQSTRKARTPPITKINIKSGQILTVVIVLTIISFMVIIFIPASADGQLHENRFGSDLRQFCLLYLTFLLCYCLLTGGYALVKKIALGVFK